MSDQSPVRDILRVLPGPRRRELAILTAATSVASVLEVSGIFLVIPLIRMLHSPDWIHDTAILQSAYEFFGFQSEQKFILAFSALALGIFFLKNAYMIVVYRWQRSFADSGTRELTNNLLRAYFLGRYDELARMNKTVVGRSIRDLTPRINRMVALGAVNAAAEIIAIVGIIAALFFVETLSALVVGVAGLLIGFFLYQAVGTWLEKQSENQQSELPAGNRLFGDALSAMKEIRLLGHQDHFLDQLNASYDRETSRAGARQFANQAMRPISEMVMLAGIIVVLASVIVTSTPDTSLASLSILLLVAIRVLPSLNRLLRAASGIRNGLPALSSYLGILDALSPITTPATAKGAAPRLRFEKSLHFDNVVYTYQGTQKPTIRTGDLTIKPGAFVGVVGPSGAGKSTLIDLLLGVLEPDSGRILVDGVNVRDDLAGWWSNVGYVPQEVVLLDDNVRRNVTLGIADEKIDDDRVREAIKLAGFGWRADHSPNWVRAPLGDAGSRLSAGQKQRIGIARAMYNDPEVLVFDDALRDLDNWSQRNVLENLRDLPGRRTLVLVSQDLSLVRDCDVVIFMRDGDVNGFGTFDDLVATNPAFRNLARQGGLVKAQRGRRSNTPPGNAPEGIRKSGG